MINEHYIPEAVILANSEYPAYEFPLRLLAEAQSVVYCDGAANEYISRRHTPNVIIGDEDSFLPEYKKRFSSIILQISDRETNDQAEAVHYLQSKGIRKIAIIDATSKRGGYTLGNISLLMEYVKSGMEVRTVTDYRAFISMGDTQSFASYPDQQVSIINFGAKGLKAERLFHSLSDFTDWW